MGIFTKNIKNLSISDIIKYNDNIKGKLFYSQDIYYDEAIESYGIKKCPILIWKIKRITFYIGSLFSKKIANMHIASKEKERKTIDKLLSDMNIKNTTLNSSYLNVFRFKDLIETNKLEQRENTKKLSKSKESVVANSDVDESHDVDVDANENLTDHSDSAESEIEPEPNNLNDAANKFKEQRIQKLKHLFKYKDKKEINNVIQKLVDTFFIAGDKVSKNIYKLSKVARGALKTSKFTILHMPGIKPVICKEIAKTLLRKGLALHLLNNLSESDYKNLTDKEIITEVCSQAMNIFKQIFQNDSWTKDANELIKIAECDDIRVKKGGKRSYKHIFQELFDQIDSSDLTTDQKSIKVTRMAIVHLIFYGVSLIKEGSKVLTFIPDFAKKEKEELIKIINKNVPTH